MESIRDRFTTKDTRDYPYLQAVMKESLRLFPATGFGLTRVIPKGGLTMAGYFFPEGVSLFSSVFARPLFTAQFLAGAVQCRIRT